MLNWDKFVNFIHILKGRRREQAAFAIAAVCLPAGYAIGGKSMLPDFKDGLNWEEIVQLTLYAAGLACLGYTAFRVWRLAHPPELLPVKDRPTAIKGPMAFTEADGELFRKLGRENELRKLLGLVLDNQVSLIVVRGASGAGKSSLLRAGLKHILNNSADGKDVKFHYWEAVPTESDKGLLRAVQEKWPEGASKPESLGELVNPTDALGRQLHVIVLDQFEQLRGSRKIFQLLRRIVRESRPPHRITWVIAFRREFSADWMDFVSPELERGARPPLDVSLRFFTADQAREVIGQLVNESNLKESIEQDVIENLVEAATVDGEVSPVDIGIGLLVLTELHERQIGKTVTIRDYQFAGGAEGLLTQYINRCLELFPKEDQEVLLKAMLALRDPDTNQRLAEGLTIEYLANETGGEPRLLKTQINRLSDRDVRLLETVTPEDGAPARYRLPHERLIPALYRLTGKLLAEVDQARLKFQNAFQAWKINDKRRHYFLKAKELRLVERYEAQIPWGADEEEKKSFLYLSKRRRRFVRSAAAVLGLMLIALAWASALQYQRIESKKYLRDESGYPPELIDFQHRLKKLEMVEPLNLDRFTWLISNSIEELSLKAAISSNSIAGLESLSQCASLKKLTLGLSESQVSNLEPLSKLGNLTKMTLDLRSSQASNLESLSKLRNLTQLTLDLSSSQVSDLEPLSKLSNLTQLTLDLRSSQVSNLEPLSKLSNRTQLTLSLDLRGVRDLEPLSKLSNLTQLTLDLRSSQVSNLESLSKLSNLTQLTLDLNFSQVSNLESLSKLSNLTQLTLNPSRSRVSNLESLSRLSNLTQLRLFLSYSQVRDLEPLSKLSNLTQLTLDLRFSQVSNLEPLSKLSNLTKLTLDLHFSQVSNLESLSKLSSLTQLTLDLSYSHVSNLEPLTKLSNLTQLTLNLRGSQVSNLEPLTKLSNLTQLTLNLIDSSVSELEPLTKLMQLKRLSIEGATRAQRMSLRKIPASLKELKF